MTAKEKSTEIVKMLQGVIYDNGAGHESTVSFNKIKDIACLFVDGFLALYDRDFQDKKDKTYWHPYDFWLSVKDEINNL